MEPKRRQLLLEVAAHEFALRGYERASLNRIIRTCGMSKSSFYHFVDSKAGLFDAVVEAAASALRRDMAIPTPDTFSGTDFWQQLDRLGQRLTGLSGRNTWYVDFGKLFYLPDAPETESPALQTVNESISSWVQGVITVGQGSGALRTDLPDSMLIDLAVAVLRTLDAWFLMHMADVAPEEMAALGNRQLDIIRRLLAP